MKKKLVTFTALLISLTFSMFANETGDLEVKLNIYKSFSKKMNTAHIILVNKGKKPITVFTKGLSQSINFDKETGKANLTLQMSNVSFKGHKLISSKYEFSPVTLNPGEATKYTLLSKPFTNDFFRLKTEMKDITVSYQMTKDDGKRYKIWAGKASSKAFKVKNEINN